MFIVWGTKAVYRKIGYAADFCPICRRARPFLIRRVGMASHVYYLATGEGKLAGFDRTCEHCKTILSADPQTYKTVLKSYTSLAALQTDTFPNFSEAFAKRLEVEQQISESPTQISNDDRIFLIREPFLVLAPKVEQLYESTQVDKEVGISLVIGIVIFSLGISTASFFAQDHELAFIFTSFLICISLIIWSMSTSSTRRLRRKIAPIIVGCLRPLNPTENEFSSVLSELNRYGYKIGAKLRPRDLFNMVATPLHTRQKTFV